MKFLKPVDIINIGDGLQWIKITDFFQKVGFIAFNQMGKIFIWDHEVYLHVPVEYTVRRNLLNWCNLVSIGKKLRFYVFGLVRIY